MFQRRGFLWWLGRHLPSSARSNQQFRQRCGWRRDSHWPHRATHMWLLIHPPTRTHSHTVIVFQSLLYLVRILAIFSSLRDYPDRLKRHVPKKTNGQVVEQICCGIAWRVVGSDGRTALPSPFQGTRTDGEAKGKERNEGKTTNSQVKKGAKARRARYLWEFWRVCANYAMRRGALLFCVLLFFLFFLIGFAGPPIWIAGVILASSCLLCVL